MYSRALLALLAALATAAAAAPAAAVPGATTVEILGETASPTYPPTTASPTWSPTISPTYSSTFSPTSQRDACDPRVTLGCACVADEDCFDGSACTANTCANGECEAAYLPGVTEVKVELTTDHWPEDVAWTLKDGDGVVQLEGGDYSEPDARHVAAHCATEGHQATFEIADGWGDGTCCDWGDGRYLIKVNGEEVASGGDYGWGATETFAVPQPVVYFTGEEVDCHRPILTSESCKQVAKQHALPFKWRRGSTKFPGGCFLWVRKSESDEKERTATIAWNPKKTAGTNCKGWKQCACWV